MPPKKLKSAQWSATALSLGAHRAAPLTPMQHARLFAIANESENTSSSANSGEIRFDSSARKAKGAHIDVDANSVGTPSGEHSREIEASLALLRDTDFFNEFFG